MRIGLFTDTYFPQVSGVATSIRTLKTELEKQGHAVFIFTTTDKDVNRYEDWQIIRIPSVPFFAFKDRRFAYRGFSKALEIAKQYQLDIIHTQTEFSLGLLGIWIAHELKIPVIHTYHTQYEDYVHYIAKGMLIRPSMVKYLVRGFLHDVDGVICPSEIVHDLLSDYKVKVEKRVIPTGIELAKFERPEIKQENLKELRSKLGIQDDEKMLLSLSRISYEKNIQAIIQGLPQIIEKLPQTRLVIVGNGPYLEDLKELAEELEVSEYVQFTGEVPNEEDAIYYKAADYFVSASTSETQGLTYTEAMAAGVQCVAEGNAYLNNLFDHESLGKTFKTDSDFAPTLIDYIQANIKMDQTILDEKLFEISSTNFGNKMIEFYQDTLIYFDQLQMEKENADSIKKIKVKFTSLRK